MSAHTTSSMHYDFTTILARYSVEVSSLQGIYEPLRNTDSLIQFLSLNTFLIVHMLNAFCTYMYIFVQKIYCTKILFLQSTVCTYSRQLKSFLCSFCSGVHWVVVMCKQFNRWYEVHVFVSFIFDNRMMCSQRMLKGKQFAAELRSQCEF